MSKVGLVLEGGANRGIFTAGVLDVFQREGVQFDYVIAVSASTCCAIDFLSKQPGRTRDMLIASERVRDVKWSNLLIGKSLIDFDYMFSVFDKEYPFDWGTFSKNSLGYEFVVTDCLNGKPSYISACGSKETLFELSAASCSMPYITPMVKFAGGVYMDGGVTDSLPISRAIAKGCDKLVIVTTKSIRKVKKDIPLLEYLNAFLYSDYPELVESLNMRRRMDNSKTFHLSELQHSKDVVIVSPLHDYASGLCTRRDLLYKQYLHGRNVCYKNMKQIGRLFSW